MHRSALVLLCLLVMTTETEADTVRDKQMTWGRGFLQEVPGAPASTTHFEIYTDVADAKTIVNIGQNLESTYAVIARALARTGKTLPENDKTAVFVYGSRGSFNAFRRQLGIPGESFVGLYFPTGVLAFTMEVDTIGALRSAMIHEATHAYLGALSRAGRIDLPLWLNEGFATYVDHSEVKDGDMILGSRAGWSSYIAGGTRFHETSLAKVGAKTIRAAAKKNQLIPTERLLRAGPDEFYGEKAPLYYAQAWALVHFLIHGQEGWDTERFPSVIQRVVEGQPARDAVRIVYGLDGERLDAAYVEYLKTF